MPGTLTAHFVPRSKFLQSRDINAPVDFFLGFSYDGLRAWEVEYPGEYRGPARPESVPDGGLSPHRSIPRQFFRTPPSHTRSMPISLSRPRLQAVRPSASCST